MYTLKTEQSFDSAHFLADYVGKCRNIHGHRWRVIIEIQGDALLASGEKRGMLVDFGDLKNDLKKLADELDHSLIIESGSLKDATMEALRDEEFRIVEFPFRPTAENFAKYFYDRMSGLGYRVRETVVYETPNNCASYSEA